MLTIGHKPYLIFNINASIYGIEAQYVQEIFSLPELTPIAEAPRDIVGVVNLRGNILPVMDLNLRLGYRQLEYSLTDSVVVLQWQNFRLGIIVDRVHEVHNIFLDEVTNELFHGQEITANSQRFLAGVAKVSAEIVMLLNAENLLSYSRSVENLDIGKSGYNPELEETNASNLTTSYKEHYIFCPHATPEERATLRERAQNLRRVNEKEDFAGLIALAVIGLNGEYFGLDLQIVREFTDIGKVTPVPCCPNHIVGNMNLRGEIVTLVDIRNLLNLPMTSPETGAKVMLVRVEDLVVGMKVDEVFDVMYLQPSQIQAVPAALHSISDEYLQGTAPYREKMMTLLDLGKMFKKGTLVVNEEV